MGGLFSTPKAPTPAPTPVMPTVDDAAVQAQRKRAIAAQNLKQGRQSTFLSKAGGGQGGATTLGG